MITRNGLEVEVRLGSWSDLAAIGVRSGSRPKSEFGKMVAVTCHRYDRSLGTFVGRRQITFILTNMTTVFACK